MEQQQQEVYNAVLVLLSHDPDGSVKKLLETIVEWEKNHPPKDQYDGFSWYDVFGDARTLNSLVTRRILRVVLKTNKYCCYRTLNMAALEKALADYEGAFTQETLAEEQIPSDLFKMIVGHEDKKNIIMRSISAEKPVHCLLWGSVASAKTLTLEDLARLPRSRFILGSSLTRAGLFDVLFNERPRYLIIDELEKIDDIENLCFSEDTQVLTDNGWKQFNQVAEGDIVLTFNVSNHVLEYQPVLRKWVSDYEGDMFHLLGRYADLLVSPHHRIITERQTSRNGRHINVTEIVEAQQLFGGMHQRHEKYEKARSLYDGGGMSQRAIMTSIGVGAGTVSRWVNGITEPKKRNTLYGWVRVPVSGKYTIIESIPDDIIRVVGWVVTEGWSRYGKYLGISQSVKNTLNVEEIDSLLQRLELEYSRRVDKNGVVRWEVRNIVDPIFKDLLREPHRIPRRVLVGCSSRQLRILYETLMKGDGYMEKNRRIYYTINDGLVDDVQELCVKGQLRSTVSFRNFETMLSGRRYSNKTKNIRITERTYAYFTIHKENYRGVIGCVTTENGTVVARRNGKVCITGNSALLSLMHKGYVTETKYKRHRTVRLKTWVFGSANDISRLPKELLSRFALLRFRDYTDDEFREVTVNVLREQEDIPENLAVYIAEKVLRELNSRDVRDAVRCSRLLKTKTKEEIDSIISILKRQK